MSDILASIQKIIDIKPIEGADRIELVTVQGWTCVISKKDNFKIDDLCIYFELDSLLPEQPEFEFLRSKKFRIKTMKMIKGTVISQGLVFPLSILDSKWVEDKPKKIEEGIDVTKCLKVEKYLSVSEREERFDTTAKKKHNAFTKFMTRFSWYRKLTKTRSKSFPEFLSVTDEENCQKLSNYLEKYKDEVFYVAEKMEGSSATFWYKKTGFFGNEFGICSRNVRKFEFDNSNWSRAARQMDIKKKLKSVRKDIAIQGELCGPSIQGNIYNLSDLELFVFNVYDIKAKRYYTLNEMILFCEIFGFKTVPILDTNFKLFPTVEEMLNYSNGKSVLYDTKREGVVFRTHDRKISFKARSPEYLSTSEI